MLKSKDAITGAISAVFGAIVLLSTSRLPDSNMAGDIGPRVFPYIAGGLMLFCGLILLVINLKGPKREEKAFLTGEGKKRLFALLVVLILYIFAMGRIGFLVPSMVALFALMTMLSGDKQVVLWKRILISVLIPLVIYIAFVKGLSLRMPTGAIEKALNRRL